MKDKPTGDQPAFDNKQPLPALDMAQMALDAANVGIWILDAASWNFLPSNRTKALFGFLPEEEMSFDDALLKIAGKHRRLVLAGVKKAIKQLSNLYMECPVMIPSGKKKPLA